MPVADEYFHRRLDNGLITLLQFVNSEKKISVLKPTQVEYFDRILVVLSWWYSAQYLW